MILPFRGKGRQGYISIIHVMMSEDKTLNGEMSKTMELHGYMDGMSMDKLSGELSQLIKLIEFDEGIPFQLMFGKEPGEGNYFFIGDGIEKLTGVSSSAFSEKILLAMVKEVNPLSEKLPADIPGIRQSLIHGSISDYRLEMRLAIPDGTEKWVRETSIAMRDEYSGKVWGVQGIFHDITERKSVTAYLNEAMEKAGESDRLKTTFLQNISHEVRTPLNAIIGFSTMLCEPEKEYCRSREFVSMINNSTDHFLEVMDNIMEISRIEAGSVKVVLNEVNPAELVKKIHNIFRTRAEENGLQLEYIISGNIPALMTDGHKLYRIINNLVANAVKFTPSGKVGFGFRVCERAVEFFVSDTGIGIPDCHKPNVFNKFYQAESGSTRQYSGIGLGLSISRAYVEMLGGSISFESEEGAGSTFIFSIPVKS